MIQVASFFPCIILMFGRRFPLQNCFPGFPLLRYFQQITNIAASANQLFLRKTNIFCKSSHQFLPTARASMAQQNVEKFGTDIRDWRKVYSNEEEPFLLEENLPSKNPFEVFDAWFKNVAAKSDISFVEVNAACFSTAVNNRPRSRVVLVKQYDKEGFCFYTHYNSAKGKEISENAYGCMLFYWPSVDRQIRVEGKMEKLPVNEAEAYWYSRPLKSRIGSKLSEQSKIIPDRQYLENKKKELEQLAAEKGEKAITRPEDWGGYRLRPDYFEFWQGQSDRIHDRIIFEKTDDASEWSIKRLSP